MDYTPEPDIFHDVFVTCPCTPTKSSATFCNIHIGAVCARVRIRAEKIGRCSGTCGIWPDSPKTLWACMARDRTRREKCPARRVVMEFRSRSQVVWESARAPAFRKKRQGGINPLTAWSPAGTRRQAASNVAKIGNLVGAEANDIVAVRYSSHAHCSNCASVGSPTRSTPLIFPACICRNPAQSEMAARAGVSRWPWTFPASSLVGPRY